ncbi:MAG: S-methyl-5-thioribose-1-phosphate isomerase [Candidatus Kapaibacterium sp.]
MEYHRRSIWLNEERTGIFVIDQRLLPGKVETLFINSTEGTIHAIQDMVVRGAPLIGVTAAYGMWLAARENEGKENFAEKMEEAAKRLQETRPTAVNLVWALERQLQVVAERNGSDDVVEALLNEAEKITEEDVEMCREIGLHGFDILEEIAQRKGNVNILTHCNAGRLACVEYGTATSPIYIAHERGIDLHVWVDETRPRLQGAKLTAFELAEAGIPHTVIPDNAAGHVMARGMVDMVIVGCDRLTSNGDACNKIGTYTKALAAQDNDIPFYVALPSSTIDWKIEHWKDIPIEERSGEEVSTISGISGGEMCSVTITPENSPTANYSFDVTPARLITNIITEKGISHPNKNDLRKLFTQESTTNH